MKLKVIIQQENKDGEFETIATNKNIVGVVFDGDKPDLLITAADSQMAQACGMLLGYVTGKNEAKVIKVGDNDV